MSTLQQIQLELKAPKSKRNTFGNYNYRNCEDILEAVKPLLQKYNATPGLEIRAQTWPTPKASDWNKRGNVSAHPRNGLPGAVMNFPTPTASDATKWSNQSLAERQAKGQQVRLNTAVSPQGGNGGRLNPDWVEWLMEWPIGWTDLKAIGNGQVSIVAVNAYQALGMTL